MHVITISKLTRKHRITYPCMLHKKILLPLTFMERFFFPTLLFIVYGAGMLLLTEASVGDFQVPKVDPKVVCGDKVLSVTVRVDRVHVICVGICEHSSETCCDRRAGH